MAEKKKFTLEYEVKSSPRILYSFISEPNGLSQWFADDVNFRDQVYTFTWDDEEQKAKLVSIKENKLVKFKWLDDEPQCYFEMEIVQDELTNDVALAITDFSTDELLAEKKLIWDNQIDLPDKRFRCIIFLCFVYLCKVKKIHLLIIKHS